MTGREIENLIKLLSRLPGLGPRSARRAVLQMLKKPETLMIPLANSLHETAEQFANLRGLAPVGNAKQHFAGHPQ